jgi:hypothetical protein
VKGSRLPSPGCSRTKERGGPAAQGVDAWMSPVIWSGIMELPGLSVKDIDKLSDKK